MNDFIQCLTKNNLLGKLIKDNEDIKFVESLNNIIVEKKCSRQGAKYKRDYYNWYVKFDDEHIYPLNLSRNNISYCKHLVNVYCISCGKFIGKYTLSQIFELKYNNSVQLNRRLLS